jgi:hypothetical protein
VENHCFCRVKLKPTLGDVRKVYSSQEIQRAWVWGMAVHADTSPSSFTDHTTSTTTTCGRRTVSGVRSRKAGSAYSTEERR